ncbi:MAG: nucleoside triphosphate pyrophosphohydrolase [Longimicrobiales bacterium]
MTRTSSDPHSAGYQPPEDPLGRVLALVRFLRRACPWDRAQTPRSLLPYLLEETHEVVDAVDTGDDDQLAAELGDLLLHLAFQIVLAEERAAFSADTVARAVEHKMVRRHPGVDWGGGGRGGEGTARRASSGREGAAADSASAAVPHWEATKARERAGSLVDGLAPGLDALSRAHRIQERVSAVGFDWAEPAGALDKAREELEEVAEALRERIRKRADAPPTPPDADPDPAVEEELGDLLFAVVNLARLSGVHAMQALRHANQKFSHRFRALEALARERDIDLAGAGLARLDALWDEVKQRQPRPER